MDEFFTDEPEAPNSETTEPKQASASQASQDELDYLQIISPTAGAPASQTPQASEIDWEAAKAKGAQIRLKKDKEHLSEAFANLEAQLGASKPRSAEDRLRSHITSHYHGDESAWLRTKFEIGLEIISDIEENKILSEHQTRCTYRYLSGKYHRKVKRASGLSFSEFIDLLVADKFLFLFLTPGRKKRVLFHYREIRDNDWLLENRADLDYILEKQDQIPASLSPRTK